MLRQGLKKAVGLMGGLMLVVQLAACADKPRDTPLGASAGASNLETKQQRDSYGAKKLALMPDGSSFAGVVIADEPTAALVARNVLERSGNAADAATALYFALSVTYPAAASLGGGGLCLVREAATGDVTSVSFPVARAQAGGTVGVPGNVRGFAYLQARYGKAAWSTLVSPAERMAATGFQVSRATARQFADNASVIAGSPAMSGTFARTGGALYGEAERMTQTPLAGTLGLIRARGVSGFYQGNFARQFVAQAAANGGALTTVDLRDYHPDVAPAQAIAADELNIMLPATDVEAGTFAKALWQEFQNTKGASSNLNVLAQKAAASVGAPADALDGDYGSTSFVTVDAAGGAVACGVTMNGAFGTGHAAPDSGVVLAATPGAAAAGRAAAFLVPVMVVRAKSKDGLFGAGAGVGSPKGGTAIASAVAAGLTGEEDAAESALASSTADAHSPANLVMCPLGLPRGTCIAEVGPGSAGVGFAAVSAGR